VYGACAPSDPWHLLQPDDQISPQGGGLNSCTVLNLLTEDNTNQ